MNHPISGVPEEIHQQREEKAKPHIAEIDEIRLQHTSGLITNDECLLAITGVIHRWLDGRE